MYNTLKLNIKLRDFLKFITRILIPIIKDMMVLPSLKKKKNTVFIVKKSKRNNYRLFVNHFLFYQMRVTKIIISRDIPPLLLSYLKLNFIYRR